MAIERIAGLETKKARIAGHFRDLDSNGGIYQGSPAYLVMLSRCVTEIGPTNFGVIEEAFREQGLNTHFLAVSRGHTLRTHPDKNAVVTNINDLFLKKRFKQHDNMPYAALAFPSREDLDKYVEQENLYYDPVMNKRNLRQAGGVFTLHDVNALPITDPAKAEWN